jgi:hypothetical protein
MKVYKVRCSNKSFEEGLEKEYPQNYNTTIVILPFFQLHLAFLEFQPSPPNLPSRSSLVLVIQND